MEMERVLPFAVDDDDDGVAAVLPPPPSPQHRRRQLQDGEDEEEAELSDQERGGEDEGEDGDEDEDELDDAARYLPDRRRQSDYDHRPTTQGRLIVEQIHRSMVAGVLMMQSREFDFYTVLARVLEETNGGGGGGGGPASAAAVADLEKQAFHANAIEECGGVATECAICLMEFEDGEEVSVMPCSRGHQFHTDCIAKWLGHINSCPLCRRALPTAATGVEDQ